MQLRFTVLCNCLLARAFRSRCPLHRTTVCDSLTLLVAACAACDGFGFARNTATTFDVFYWLQVTNFDVLLNSAPPNGPDYIDILGLCLHAQLIS
jgi:hypothetical protein